MFNNMIVNNVAALAGGGISLQDTRQSRHRAQHHRPQRQHGHGRQRLSRGQSRTSPTRSRPASFPGPTAPSSTRSWPSRQRCPTGSKGLLPTHGWWTPSSGRTARSTSSVILPIRRRCTVLPGSGCWDLAVLAGRYRLLSPTYSVLTSLDAVRSSVNRDGD